MHWNDRGPERLIFQVYWKNEQKQCFVSVDLFYAFEHVRAVRCVCVCVLVVHVVGMLVLLPLVCCFGLLSLDHAAADDAVEAAQVEESDGAEQPHRHNLDRVR